MVSLSSVFSISEMVELRANGFRGFIFSPINANGFAHVSALHFSTRFSLQNGSIWVKRDIYDPLTTLLSLVTLENPILADNGSAVWEFDAGKYKVYGLLASRPHVSIEIRSPLYSYPSTFNTPPTVHVNIEHGIHIVLCW